MAFSKQFSICRLLYSSLAPPKLTPSFHPSIYNGHRYQQNAIYHSKLSNLSRRGREIDLSPPHLLSYSPFSSSSSSSSSAATLSSRIGFVRWYVGMVKSRPILTKSITSSLIYTAADLSSQTLLLPSSEPYDFLRTMRMAGYGLFILGPSLHHWYTFVSKVLPGRDVLTTAKKIVLVQTAYGPFMTSVFLSINAALQGEDGREIIARLKRDLLPTLINGVMYWPICDFITFKFIPVHLQPLMSNGFSYLWSIYMTYMASLAKPSSE
ncbi:hypothetical protein Ancab_027868 [Ancistrocladus abbreviatus]